MLLLHISFYIFKAIIFQNIEVLGFEIFKNLKMERSLDTSAHVPIILSVLNRENYVCPELLQLRRLEKKISIL
jgi:hypothetical protein